MLFSFRFVLMTQAEADLRGCGVHAIPPLPPLCFAITCKQATSVLASHPQIIDYHP